MSHQPPTRLVSSLTHSFAAEVLARSPSRVEAKVTSHDGMPLLCAIEAALGAALPGTTSLELVWLGGAAQDGRHVLELRALQVDNVVVGEAVHELEG